MVDTSVLDGAVTLNKQALQEFIHKAVEDQVLLKEVRVETVTAPMGKILKFNIGSRVIRSPAEGQAVNTDAGISCAGVDYQTVKVMLRVPITKEAIEDSIYREKLGNKIMQLVAQAFGRDLEDLGINGDTATPNTDPDYEFLKICDGWVKQGKSGTHVYDHQGAEIDKTVFSKLRRLLPPKYRVKGLVYIMSPDMLEAFKDYLTNRATPAGDMILMSGGEVKPFGVPVITPPKWPDNEIWLTHPKNLVFIVQRDITIRKTTQSDEVVDKDLYAKYVVSARVAYVIEELEAIARATNIATP